MTGWKRRYITRRGERKKIYPPLALLHSLSYQCNRMKVKRWQHNTHSRGAHLHNTRSVRVVSAAVMLRSIRSNGRLTQIQRASVWNVDMKNDQWIGWESLVVEHARPVSRSQLTFSLVGTRCFLFKAAISIFNNRTTEQMLSPLFGCWPFVPFDRTDVRLFVTFFCLLHYFPPLSRLSNVSDATDVKSPPNSERSYYFLLLSIASTDRRWTGSMLDFHRPKIFSIVIQYLSWVTCWRPVSLFR